MMDLAMRLERTLRAEACDRVAKAVDPVLQRYGDTLRAALLPVIGHGADLAVADALARLRKDVLASANPIAERQAIDKAVQRLTAEEKSFELASQQAAP